MPGLTIAPQRRRTPNLLCLLNNDVKALDDGWLEEMLSRIGEPDVGAVGALLLWPSGVVQHGGVVLGTNFAADHAFKDRMEGDPGYGDLLRVAHECSSVTAACLVTRRLDYLDVGGMDEVPFPVNFNDVDYCLKLRARGQRIVFTPHAKLLHLESASRGRRSGAWIAKRALIANCGICGQNGEACWPRIRITVRCSRAIQYRIRRWRGLPVPPSRASILLQLPRKCRPDFDHGGMRSSSAGNATYFFFCSTVISLNLESACSNFISKSHIASRISRKVADVFVRSTWPKVKMLLLRKYPNIVGSDIL